MSIASVATTRRRVLTDLPIAYWLIAVAALVFGMVVVGGITRLTESGLSITEWKLVSGVLPPLNHREWMDAFAHYKQIPQYRDLHNGMTLAEFRGIFFWEYFHRLLGRVIGVVAIVPPLVFLAQGRIPPGRQFHYLAVPMLIALQGVLGWYMVKSGLAHRDSVSPYRLTAHLALALAAYGYAVWLAADILRREPLWLEGGCVCRFRRWARGVLALVGITILAGGFTAGLKAGFTYNTFPLMDGHWVPQGYWRLSPWYRNFFENVATVQFDHRVLAVTTFFAILAFWAAGRLQKLPRSVRHPLNGLLIAACLQVALGISTLLLVVPTALAALHQACAVALLTCAILTLHGLKDIRRLPPPSAAA